MGSLRAVRSLILCLWLLAGLACAAQEPPDYVPAPLPPPQGTVLFSGKASSPSAEATGNFSVADEERNALTFTAYNLNVHLSPAQSAISVLAQVTVRNDGGAPLTRVALQLSSTLHWESFSEITPVGARPLRFGHQRLATDADHTGSSEEAIVSLNEPLPAGASLTLDALYAGTIPASAQRLLRIGAPSREALFADWDHIGPAGTFLRGFGNVLWYPVAAPPILLGDGARLFALTGEQKARQREASVSLRLTVEFTGAAPKVVFFNGKQAALKRARPIGEPGSVEVPAIATAEFKASPLGFRAPNLFLSDQPASMSPDGFLTDVPTASVAAGMSSSWQTYADAAKLVQPLLASWLSAKPMYGLTLFQNEGQPFEDQSFVVAPLRAANTTEAAATLTHSLTHAWFRSRYVWLDEGVPQFMALLWLERQKGREAAMVELREQAHTLAFAEASLSPVSGNGTNQGDAGQSLIGARDEVYYRNKAVAVLSMLRFIIGDESLQGALKLYDVPAGTQEDPANFEHAAEEVSKKDLHWLFDDWVYHDRGLPELTIMNVSPRQLEATAGRKAGWLIAVEVGNDGGAAAEVPITIRSGELTRTEHLRIGAHARASMRIVFEGVPDELLVNDGSTPEAITSTHAMKLVVH